MAVSEHIERLIVRRLDGESTQDEQFELDRELLRCPEARAMFDNYQLADDLAAKALTASFGARRAYEPAAHDLQTASPAGVAGRSNGSIRRVGSGKHAGHWRRNWMLYTSAMAACIAFLLVINTPAPDLDMPAGSPGTTALASAAPVNAFPASANGFANNNAATDSGVIEVPGAILRQVGPDVGVYRVSSYRPQQFERKADREYILVPGADGAYYLLAVDQIQEVRHPDKGLLRQALDPI